ncbi:response regulator transcription factor [Paenibacillus chondroitinus]|uniref:Response regulator transcription factor n=1 Tax=Paenibacillus chondroitinus TaxID=59842 RepID=A0ABU6D7P4_9BACL|nr:MULTISPECIES: response regulator transcription factor [Paenibacillus]MCY9661649.1 response regulator transcription factor [Paenibacillus anseongense]MEB4793734.1 response regulator transcription factor [Paenibacillus chondroitinus]
MSHKLLVIEDEEKIARLLQLELTHAGYIVELASDGSEGLRKALNEKWDLILLDILLPVYNGFELIKSFRKKNSETPIIVVTACDTPADIVNGLDLGGQDYITKPFHLEELLARIRACIRRQNQFQQPDDELNKQDSLIYTVKGTNVNLRSREVLQNNIKIDFTPKEFELLVYLIEHQNEILSREQIMNHVWGYDFLGNSNLVDVYIRYVRKKLLAPYPNIRTIRGIGYLLEV